MAVSQQQIEYLNAMGIPIWVSRQLAVPEQLAANHQSSVVAAEPVNEPITPAPTTVATPKSSGSLRVANDLIRDLQQDNTSTLAAIELEADAPATESVAPTPIAVLDTLGWSELQQSVANCTACSLHTYRQQPVFGQGNLKAKWMIVGDIPREEDEQQQQPFSGESGVLLAAMLASLDLAREQVYLSSLVKCRPPLDSSPSDDQAQSCLSYLQRQIELIQPELVILMGRDSAQQVLGRQDSMVKLRQRIHHRDGITTPFMVTYHPAYLLKQPRLKAQAWQDLQFAQQATQ